MIVAAPEQPSATVAAGETFLAPGQRYLLLDQPEQVTVARLVRDSLGLLHVTLRTSTGRELSAFARQVEEAITGGNLVPLGRDLTLAC